MGLMMPSQADMEQYVRDLDLTPDHNFLIVYTKMNDVAKGLLSVFTRSTSMYSGAVERPHYFVITPEEILLQGMGRKDELQRMARNQVHGFAVHDRGDHRIIEFTYRDQDYHFYALRGSAGRVKYVSENLDSLAANHWLGLAH